MRMHFEDETAPTRITSYGAGFVSVNEERHTSSVILLPHRVHPGWRPRSANDLLAEDIDALLAGRPEIVLLGTGLKQCFPAGPILEPAYDKRIGIEIMDTMAACRTFNVLAAENRHVVAGLILETLAP